MNPDRIRRKGFVRTRDNIPVKYADPDKGLTFDQVELRHACGWGNSAPQTVGRTQAEIVKVHVFTFFNLIFALLALILLLTGSELWNMAFLLVAVCNTIIGIVQELRAKQAVDRLTLVTDQRFNTVRDGELVALSAHMLVRDDIVEFSAGDHICADAMVRTGELQVNESLITGEAGAVLKTPGDTLRSGTYVLAGAARAQLTQVGAAALAAQLTAQVRQNPTPRGSEMRKALEGLLRIIACLLVPVGIALFCQAFSAGGWSCGSARKPPWLP
jgi:cation-transporting ATPase E